MSSTDEIKSIAEGKKIAGNTAFAAKDYNEAIRLYSEAIDLNGSNHIYFSNRSACYSAIGRNEEAAKDAQRCIELNAQFLKGYYRLSAAKLELGDIDGAYDAVLRGLKIDSSNGDLIRQSRLVKAKREAANAMSKNEPVGQKQFDKQTIDEIQEIGRQVDASQRELAEVSSLLQACVRDQRRAQLTRTEIDSLDIDARLYRSIGKLFMLNSKGEIQAHLNAQTTERKESEEKLKGKKAYIEKKLASQRSNLNELIGAKQ